jgi:predicted choloylglycine hydrolase
MEIRIIVKLLLFFLLVLHLNSVACTIFSAADSCNILAGNNEDYWLDGIIHFTPSTQSYLGRVTFGFDNQYAQGGVNEKGLFFDWAATSTMPWKESANRQSSPGLYIRGVYDICELMLATCSTVEEAVQFFDAVNLSAFSSAHIMIADSTGASAIIEWGINDIVVIWKNHNYQVCANYNFTNQANSVQHDVRYNTAVNSLKSESNISIELFRQILSSVSQSITEYSNIYDLKNGDIYFFTDRNFNEYIKINVKEELKKGLRDFNINSLFAGIHNFTPYNNQLIETSLQNISWMGKDGKYDFLCSTDSLFADLDPISVESRENACSIQVELAPSKIYFWKVTVKATSDFNSESILNKFTTADHFLSGIKNTDRPQSFLVSQNYPNPFNPSTMISFDLPANSVVSLKVFDLIGREVAVIVSEELSAGSYSRTWNAANMSSGIYFYRLQSGSFTETKKLVLLR